MTTIAEFPAGVKPHFTLNCPFAVISDIRFPSPPEVVIEFVSGLRKIPVTLPSINDVFNFWLVKRLAREQHDTRLQFYHERMLSSRRDREGYFRLLVVDALCEAAERAQRARETKLTEADDAVPMVPVCGGASHA